MSQTQYEIAVIGGGIIGLATAMALTARKGVSVLVLEAEGQLASHQTGHNSGVIHSGLYYRPGSLKARTCVSGRDLLYRFCDDYEIHYEQCGKIVVAVDAHEVDGLHELARRGEANGLRGIELLDGDGIREHEPHVRGVAGLYVPETGIVDYVAVADRFAQILRSRGGRIVTGARLIGFAQDGGDLLLRTESGEFRCRHLINCAGLFSDRVARLCGLQPEIAIIPFRGEYYELRESSRHLVRNLIYPVPDSRYPFLGVHFTRMIGGGIEAGPNAVLALKREGYKRLDMSPRDLRDVLSYRGFYALVRKYWKTGAGEFYRSFSKAAFVRALQRLIPEITAQDVFPSGAGVRAQAVDRHGALVDDFRIIQAENMIHVLNAPSPGATASISIGQYIGDLADAHFDMQET